MRLLELYAVKDYGLRFGVDACLVTDIPNFKIYTTIFSTAVPITGTIQVFGCTTVVGQSDLMPDCTCYPMNCTTLIGLSCITKRFRKCGGTKSSPGNAHR